MSDIGPRQYRCLGFFNDDTEVTVTNTRLTRNNFKVGSVQDTDWQPQLSHVVEGAEAQTSLVAYDVDQ